MKEQKEAILLYESIENNESDSFMKIVENHDLKWLQSLAIDPDIFYVYDFTLPLELAIKVGNEQIVAKLLDMGVEPNSFFEKAVMSGNPKIVELLINAGFEIKQNNNNFLSLAAERGDLEIAKLLMERGADINDYDDDHVWVHPLVESITQGHIHVYEYLLEIVKKKDFLNAIALQRIAIVGNKKILKFLLIKKNINVDSKNCLSGNTALIAAVGATQLSMVDYLISVGANVNIQNFFGETALITAVQNNSMTLVKKLLAARADKNLKNNDDNTALDLAIEQKDRIITKLLQSDCKK